MAPNHWLQSIFFWHFSDQWTECGWEAESSTGTKRGAPEVTRYVRLLWERTVLKFRSTHTHTNEPSIYTGSLFLPQPVGSGKDWSGSSGPGSTMTNNCRSARRNSWTRGSRRRGGALLWRESASRHWRRRKWVLTADIPNVSERRPLSQLRGLCNLTTEACFPEN